MHPISHPWRRSDSFRGGSFHDDGDTEDEDAYVEPYPIPDAETMEERHAFREAVRKETLELRRTIPQQQRSGMRNIMVSLYDRERYGGSERILRRQSGRKKAHSKSGARSPSTVFESPTTTSMLYHQDTSPPPQHETVRGDSDVDDDENKDETSNPATDTSADDSRGDSSSRDQASPISAAKLRPDDDADEEPLKRRRKKLYPMAIVRELRTFAEYASALNYQSAFLHHLGGDDVLDEQGNRPASSWAVSTISIAFSPDGKTMASTHGDHTVKISSCNTGRLLQTLDGHPRTPWTVKYHPFDSSILASGCLGHQVRLWNWVEKTCLQMVRLEYAIISLSFHPTGKVLAISNGTRLHFWGIDGNEGGNRSYNNADDNAAQGGRMRLTEMDQRHMLRCVHFPPNGNTLVIGGVNPSTDDARRRNRSGGIGGGGMSFYLRLWDFDLDRALNPQSDMAANGISIARRPISNVRFVAHTSPFRCSSLLQPRKRPASSLVFFADVSFSLSL